MESELDFSFFSDHIPDIRTGHNNHNNHMNKLPLNMGEGEGSKSHPQDRARQRDEPGGSSRGGEHRKHSPTHTKEDKCQGWTWSQGLHIIYHPRECKICVEYIQHIMQAEFSMDDAFIAVKHLLEEEEDFWQKKATRYMDDLDDVEAHICHLEVRIREMEEELAGPCEYKDHRGGKRARYDSSNGKGSGVASPAPSTPAGKAYATSSQRESRRVHMLPTAHIEEDVQIEMWHFHPSLDQHHLWQRPSGLLNFSVVPTGCQPLYQEVCQLHVGPCLGSLCPDMLDLSSPAWKSWNSIWRQRICCITSRQ
jgi:hypothetical protein